MSFFIFALKVLISFISIYYLVYEIIYILFKYFIKSKHLSRL
jgi:hypothetical protein